MNAEKKPTVIVVGTDYSETSELALARAFELAADDAKGVVHLVHVLPPEPYAGVGPFSEPECAENLRRYAQERLDAFGARRPDRPPTFHVICHVRKSSPWQEIVGLAEDVEADLIVLGTHGRRGAERWLLGSVAESVVRLAPCPVLVMRQKSLPQPAPRIEPPCPRCVEARKASSGQQYWCEQHQERHGQRHVYHQSDRVSKDSNFPLVYRL